MNIREISADEALECLAEGGRCYILKELCEITPVSEMLCARFVVEVPEETEAQELQPEKLSGGGKAEAPVKKRKTLDWGKIQALHKAGWSHAKIADEMGATVSTIATGLSKLRREAEDSGKKQSSKAHPGAEKADG